MSIILYKLFIWIFIFLFVCLTNVEDLEDNFMLSKLFIQPTFYVVMTHVLQGRHRQDKIHRYQVTCKTKQ